MHQVAALTRCPPIRLTALPKFFNPFPRWWPIAFTALRATRETERTARRTVLPMDRNVRLTNNCCNAATRPQSVLMKCPSNTHQVWFKQRLIADLRIFRQHQVATAFLFGKQLVNGQVVLVRRAHLLGLLRLGLRLQLIVE